MRAVLVLLVLAGSQLWPPGTAALAQAADPAAGLTLKAEQYRAVLGRPPAPGSPAEADDLASQRLAGAISRDVIASPQWQAFRQQLRPELGKLLVPPPAGLPLRSD